MILQADISQAHAEAEARVEAITESLYGEIATVKAEADRIIIGVKEEAQRKIKTMEQKVSDSEHRSDVKLIHERDSAVMKAIELRKKLEDADVRESALEANLTALRAEVATLEEEMLRSRMSLLDVNEQASTRDQEAVIKASEEMSKLQQRLESLQGTIDRKERDLTACEAKLLAREEALVAEQLLSGRLDTEKELMAIRLTELENSYNELCNRQKDEEETRRAKEIQLEAPWPTASCAHRSNRTILHWDHRSSAKIARERKKKSRKRFKSHLVPNPNLNPKSPNPNPNPLRKRSEPRN